MIIQIDDKTRLTIDYCSWALQKPRKRKGARGDDVLPAGYMWESYKWFARLSDAHRHLQEENMRRSEDMEILLDKMEVLNKLFESETIKCLDKKVWGHVD